MEYFVSNSPFLKTFIKSSTENIFWAKFYHILTHFLVLGQFFTSFYSFDSLLQTLPIDAQSLFGLYVGQCFNNLKNLRYFKKSSLKIRRYILLQILCFLW